jgi:hypothetical protein
MHTAYGFVYRRDRDLSPAAQAFMGAVRAVEAEVVEQEERLTRIAFQSKARPLRTRPTAKRRRQPAAASGR